MDTMLPDLQYDITGVPSGWLWKGKHLMGLWGEYCIVPLGSSWYFYLLRCSWGGSILQELLGPCWKMASLWPSSSSCSASHPRFGPDPGFTPNSLGLRQAGACEGTWARTQMPREQWHVLWLGKWTQLWGTKTFQIWCKNVRKGLCSGILSVFFPRFPPTKTSPFPLNSSHL